MRWLPRDGDRAGRKKTIAISAWHSRSRTRNREVGERGRDFFAARFCVADAAMDGGGSGTGDSCGSSSTWQIGEERRKGEMRQPTIGTGVSRVLTWGNVCPLFRFGAVLRFGTDKRRYSGCADCVDFDLLQISRDSLLQLQVTSF